MKKYLLIAICLVLFKNNTPAAPIVIPGSSFPVVTTLGSTDRLLIVRTNSSPSTNVTIAYTDLELQLAAQINPSFPWTIITNGSPDSVIQAQFNLLTNGGVIAFQSGTNYPTLSTNIYITNSMTVYGNGVTLRATNNLVGFMLDTTTNYNKPIIIDNLVFDGQVVLPFNTTNYDTTFNGSHDPYYNSFWTNRSGLRINSAGGARIQNCTFKCWSGNGCFAIQTLGTFNAQNQPKFEFLFNRCYTNFIGLFIPGASYQFPGYYNADSSLWNDNNNAEYALVQGNDFFNNQRGVIPSAGNCLLQGNTINGNWMGASLYPANNGGHGNYVGNTMNHNYYIVYAESTQGGVWQDNQMLANDAIVFNNCNNLEFKNNSIGRAALYFTNLTVGTFENNIWDATAIWGQDIVFPGVYTNISSAVRISGNHAIDGTNTDGTSLGGTFRYNGFTAASNMPPTSAEWKGQMFYWNSNGANIYLIKSSAAGTTWTTTNLIN